jgi:hypothetical protein
MGQVKKSEILKRAGTTDKSISTGIKYWVCFSQKPKSYFAQKTNLNLVPN